MTKNPFITSCQVKSTLGEVGVSLSKATIKRCLCESKYRRFTIRCKPLVTLKSRKTRWDFARKQMEKKNWKRLSGPMKPNLTCTRMIRTITREEGKKQLMIWIVLHHLSNMAEAVLWHGRVVANGTGSVVWWRPMTKTYWESDPRVFQGKEMEHSPGQVCHLSS